MLAKLVIGVFLAVVLWVLWQKRHVIRERITRTSPGTVRVSLDRNYELQRKFLVKLDPVQRMKLAGLLFAMRGSDPNHYSVYEAAQVVDYHETGEVQCAFGQLFEDLSFGFYIDTVRDHDSHYQTMCRSMSDDVRLLRIYLRHKKFIAEVLDRLNLPTGGQIYSYAQRNPDIIPSPDVMQLLWSANLERP